MTFIRSASLAVRSTRSLKDSNGIIRARTFGHLTRRRRSLGRQQLELSTWTMNPVSDASPASITPRLMRFPPALLRRIESSWNELPADWKQKQQLSELRCKLSALVELSHVSPKQLLTVTQLCSDLTNANHADLDIDILLQMVEVCVKSSNGVELAAGLIEQILARYPDVQTLLQLLAVASHPAMGSKRQLVDRIYIDVIKVLHSQEEDKRDLAAASRALAKAVAFYGDQDTELAFSILNDAEACQLASPSIYIAALKTLSKVPAVSAKEGYPEWSWEHKAVAPECQILTRKFVTTGVMHEYNIFGLWEQDSLSSAAIPVLKERRSPAMRFDLLKHADTAHESFLDPQQRTTLTAVLQKAAGALSDKADLASVADVYAGAMLDSSLHLSDQKERLDEILAKLTEFELHVSPNTISDIIANTKWESGLLCTLRELWPDAVRQLDEEALLQNCFASVCNISDEQARQKAYLEVKGHSKKNTGGYESIECLEANILAAASCGMTGDALDLTLSYADRAKQPDIKIILCAIKSLATIDTELPGSAFVMTNGYQHIVEILRILEDRGISPTTEMVAWSYRAFCNSCSGVSTGYELRVSQQIRAMLDKKSLPLSGEYSYLALAPLVASVPSPVKFRPLYKEILRAEGIVEEMARRHGLEVALDTADAHLILLETLCTATDLSQKIEMLTSAVIDKTERGQTMPLSLIYRVNRFCALKPTTETVRQASDILQRCHNKGIAPHPQVFNDLVRGLTATNSKSLESIADLLENYSLMYSVKPWEKTYVNLMDSAMHRREFPLADRLTRMYLTAYPDSSIGRWWCDHFARSKELRTNISPSHEITPAELSKPAALGQARKARERRFKLKFNGRKSVVREGMVLMKQR